MSNESASVLFFLFFVADGIVIARWLTYNFTETDRPWRFTLRGILIVTAIAAFQLWFLYKQLH